MNGLRTRVPCDGCRACCQHELVVLFPEDGDDPARFEHIALPSTHGPVLILKQKDNGDCVYLGPDGCTIYGRAPVVCRKFDCRAYFLSMPRQERRQIEKHVDSKISIFKAGRQRLDTLSPSEYRAALAKRGEAELPSRQALRNMMVKP
jgi:Fe-S-cluster containining protein